MHATFNGKPSHLETMAWPRNIRTERNTHYTNRKPDPSSNSWNTPTLPLVWILHTLQYTMLWLSRGRLTHSLENWQSSSINHFLHVATHSNSSNSWNTLAYILQCGSTIHTLQYTMIWLSRGRLKHSLEHVQSSSINHFLHVATHSNSSNSWNTLPTFYNAVLQYIHCSTQCYGCPEEGSNTPSNMCKAPL